jgi:hypothetical protein
VPPWWLRRRSPDVGAALEHQRRHRVPEEVARAWHCCSAMSADALHATAAN